MLAASVVSVLLASAIGSTAFAMYIGPGTEPSGDVYNTETGKESIIIGGNGNNHATGEHSIIVGGDHSMATGQYGVTIGGLGSYNSDPSINVTGNAVGDYSVAVGGRSIHAIGTYSGAFGGDSNYVYGQTSNIFGGASNRTTENAGNSNIFGGVNNRATATRATVVGSNNSTASGESSLVAGGQYNEASELYSSAFGGQYSHVAGQYSTAIGGGSTARDADYSVAIGAGSYASVSNGTAIGQEAVADEGGTISFGHDAGDHYLTVAGNNTYTDSTYSTGVYNRLVKVGYGQNAHDAATVDQLSKVTSNDGSVHVTDTRDSTTGQHTYDLSVDTGRFGQEITNLNGRVSKLNNRINKVGAGAAALAALHPLDFDPDSKWDFAAGYGNYRNANAVAVGAFYRPNEDTMFSVGGSFGNGENMLNAGVSLKIGSGNHVSTSRVAMAKEIRDMKKTIDEISAQNAKMAAVINALVGTNLDVDKSAMFPDVPENHWAYDAVKRLADSGLVHGYPDGMFHGDRTLTRYEFAQVVYNAIEAGAKVDQRLVNEFEPELKYIRVDTVLKDKNGNPVIERVRTVKQN